MNRKALKLIILVLILGIISFLGYNVISKIQEKNRITNRIKSIPDFSFMGINNVKYEKKSINKGVATVFLYFNSECDYCHYEAQSISDSIEEFDDTQLIFISTESITKIKGFADKYNLNGKDNIIFLNDKDDRFVDLFNATSIPFTLFYDKDQTLIKTHKGQINAKGILKILKQQ